MNLTAFVTLMIFSVLPLASQAASYCPDEEEQATQQDLPAEDEGDNDCPPCPPVISISLNGVNSDHNHPLHDFVLDNTPGDVASIDLFSGFAEFCNADPSAGANYVRQQILQLRITRPCAKIIVIGHSMGGIAASYVGADSDCTVILDPPPCDRMGQLFCESMRDTCAAWDGGLGERPGYVDFERHDPFHDPEHNCQDILLAKNAIDSCLQHVRPNCNNAGHHPFEPPPGCGDPDPDPTPQPTAQPTPQCKGCTAVEETITETAQAAVL